MSEANGLPKGWSQIQLSELGKWRGGGTPSKANDRFWSNGTIPWISPKDMKRFRVSDSEDHISQLALDQTNVKQFPAGTILFVIRSGILARTFPVAISEVPATMNQDLKGLTPHDGVDPAYVAYCMIGREHDVLKRCSKHGTTVASIDTHSLQSYELPLAPLNEQRRIVAKIEELFSDLDAGVAALERAKGNLKRYRAAVLKTAVEGQLTAAWRAEHVRTPVRSPAFRRQAQPDSVHADTKQSEDRLKAELQTGSDLLARILKERRQKWEQQQLAAYQAKGQQPPKNWRTKYKEPAAPDTTNLPQLPEGWCWATVAQVSECVRYGSSAKASLDESGVPVLRMGNIQDGELDLNELKYLPSEHHEFPDLLLEDGDLLFNRTNSAELVGKSAVYKGVPNPCSYASYLIAVRFLAGCESRQLSFFLNSTYGRVWVASVVSQQVGQANVNGTKLQALAFPLPPKEEQRAIIAEVEQRLSVLEQAQSQIEVNLRRAARLRQSILKRAFEGKLVPQDPTDEPATALLKRIRAGCESKKK